MGLGGLRFGTSVHQSLQQHLSSRPRTGLDGPVLVLRVVDADVLAFVGVNPSAIAKYGMSLVVLGLAGELRAKGIAVNALWPRATIATAAIRNLLGGERVMRMSRTPAIMADAAYL